MKKVAKFFLCLNRCYRYRRFDRLNYLFSMRQCHSDYSVTELRPTRWLEKERRKRTQGPIKRKRKVVRRRLRVQLAQENRRKFKETSSVMVPSKMHIYFVTMFRFVFQTLCVNVFGVHNLMPCSFAGCVKSSWISVARRQSQGQEETKIEM